MLAKEIVPNLYVVPLGSVNVFLLVGEDLILIDTGFPESEGKILQAITELGRKPEELRHILVTHCHPDHAGSLAALQKLTKATSYAQAIDAAQIRAGEVAKRLTPTPQLLQRILFWLLIRNASAKFPPGRIDCEIKDGEVLPLAGGIRTIHAPGHSPGQVAFLWQPSNVLFVADACANIPSLDYSLGYNDFQEGKRTLVKLDKLEFSALCFGHGNAITQDASAKFHKRWKALTV